MKIQAPAKLNLTLHVTGKRPKGEHAGYHLLESDVVFLDLYDELEFELSEELNLDSKIEDNIIIKAARALDPNKGANIKLTKRIPMGGGLGGGSADAAATLVALNKLWGLNLPEKQLYEIALKLGADVPVCLYSHLNKTSSAHFSGIGEIITPFAARGSYYLLVNPNRHLATKDVFAAYGRVKDSGVCYMQPSSAPGNDLEAVAIELMPEIADILNILKGTEGKAYARMTGTGATCFAVYANKTGAEKAAAKIPEKYWKFIAAQYS